MMSHPVMTFLLVLYGLPFFILWTIIAILTKKDSKFTISKTLWLIAGFGLSHGIHEWTEFFVYHFNLRLDAIDALSLTISYYFLIQFGVSTLVIYAGRNKLLHLISIVPVILWVWFVIRLPHEFAVSAIGDVYARYSLGLLGCFLTSFALFVQRTEFSKTGQPGIIRSLYLTSGGFLFYGLLSGLIVPDVSSLSAFSLTYTTFYQTTGVPIQAFRTAVVLFIGYAMIRLLRIFEWERMSSILSAKEELERKVEERTAELAKTNEELKLLIDTEPECVKLLTADGSLLQMNRAGLNLLDAESETQVLGKKMYDLVDPQHRQAFKDLTERVFQGGSGILEFETVGLKGRRIWLETHAAPLRSERNEIIALLGITRDITARKKAEDALQRSERRYRQLFENMHEGFLIQDVIEDDAGRPVDVRYLDVNPATERFLGKTRGEIIGRSRNQVLGVPDPEVVDAISRVVNTGQPFHMVRYSSGVKRWFESFSYAIGTGQVATLIMDITERKLAEARVQQSEAKYRNLFESSVDGIFILDFDGNFIDVNSTAYTRLGYTKEEMLALNISKLDPPEFAHRVPERLKQIREHGFAVFESAHLRKDGTVMPVEVNSRLIEYEGRKVYLSVIRDITERRKAEEEIRHMAQHDALTDLPNRRLLQEIIKIETAQAKRHQTKMALLLMDLDRFKEVNDTLGHEAGDELLKEVCARFKANIRESDTLSRTGGDEFTFVVADINKAEDAADVAQKIVASLQKPFFISGHELHITTSLGISIFPDDSREIDTLIRYADIAMYYAKEQGRNTFQFYNPAINIRSVERIRLESMLRQTVERGELVVYYQPQIDIKSRKMICSEALVRWNHPELGLLESKRFMGLAEETGYITVIDEWVLRTVSAQVRRWLDAGLGPARIAVNLSAREFQNPHLVQKIANILKESGAPPEYVDIEITESLAMSNITRTVYRLKELEKMGVRALIDDFGTGYSSLSQLKRLPIQKLKIDQSFIKDIATDPDDRAIINAVTSMAHSMSMRVVAEGVETDDQLSFLRAARCDEAQGFLFSRALPACEFEHAFLTKKSA